MDLVRASVVVRFQFEGVHSWPGAPQDGPTAFLVHPHRHVFHVTAVRAVSHDDRQVEFIQLKRLMEETCIGRFGGSPHTHSCETMARWLLTEFNLESCEVSEDGENGGLVSRG